MSINRVVLIGNLTRDPEAKTISSGMLIVNFPIAVDRIKKDAKEVDFFDVTVFGKLAENCNKYLTKGKKVCIDGNLRQDRWTDPDGNKKSKIGIIANNVQFLSSKDNNSFPSEEEQTSDQEDPNLPF
jgi:single-strand DNA-binding protein